MEPYSEVKGDSQPPAFWGKFTRVWWGSFGTRGPGHSGGTIQEQEAKQGKTGDRDWRPDLLRVLCHLFLIGEAVIVRK